MTSTGRGQSINTFCHWEMKELLSVTGARPHPPSFNSFLTEPTSVEFKALCLEKNDFRELLFMDVTLLAEMA